MKSWNDRTYYPIDPVADAQIKDLFVSRVFTVNSQIRTRYVSPLTQTNRSIGSLRDPVTWCARRWVSNLYFNLVKNSSVKTTNE